MQSEQAGPWQAENMDGRPIDEACDALARKLLAGGQCTNCNQKVVINFNQRGCYWHRDGASWVQGCTGKRHATRNGEPVETAT